MHQDIARHENLIFQCFVSIAINILLVLTTFYLVLDVIQTDMPLFDRLIAFTNLFLLFKNFKK